MLRHTAPFYLCASLAVLAALTSGCSSGSSSPPTAQSNLSVSVAATPKPGPLTVSPASLSFTTKRVLDLTVSEKDYTGKFKIEPISTAIATVSPKSVAGPGPVTITVTAGNPGSTKIQVSDNHGGLVLVQIHVTTGVIVIQ